MLLPSSLPSIILFAYRVPLLCYFLWQTKFNFDFYSFEDRFRACAVTVIIAHVSQIRTKGETKGETKRKETVSRQSKQYFI